MRGVLVVSLRFFQVGFSLRVCYPTPKFEYITRSWFGCRTRFWGKAFKVLLREIANSWPSGFCLPVVIIDNRSIYMTFNPSIGVYIASFTAIVNVAKLERLYDLSILPSDNRSWGSEKPFHFSILNDSSISTTIRSINWFPLEMNSGSTDQKRSIRNASMTNNPTTVRSCKICLLLSGFKYVFHGIR